MRLKYGAAGVSVNIGKYFMAAVLAFGLLGSDAWAERGEAMKPAGPEAATLDGYNIDQVVDAVLKAMGDAARNYYLPDKPENAGAIKRYTKDARKMVLFDTAFKRELGGVCAAVANAAAIADSDAQKLPGRPLVLPLGSSPVPLGISSETVSMNGDMRVVFTNTMPCVDAAAGSLHGATLRQFPKTASDGVAAGTYTRQFGSSLTANRLYNHLLAKVCSQLVGLAKSYAEQSRKPAAPPPPEETGGGKRFSADLADRPAPIIRDSRPTRDGPSAPDAALAASPAPGEACRVSTWPLIVAEVLADRGHPCRPWIDALAGRAVRFGRASGALWSRRTRFGTGILATAAHVSSPCPTDGACAARLRDPETVAGKKAALITFGVGAGDVRSAAFHLYNAAIPDAENRDDRRSIRPRHDFSLYVVDAQRLQGAGRRTVAAEALKKEKLGLHDPLNLTLADPTHADPAPGARVLMLGYYGRHMQAHAGQLVAETGTVLSDGQARAALAALKAAGDEEGDVAYDPEAEVLVRGAAAAGMSGGGAFDEKGMMIGVMVRASKAGAGPHIVRLVRMRFVAAEIEAALARLPHAGRSKVRAFLELPAGAK